MKTLTPALLKRTLVVIMVTILLLIPASVASANVRVADAQVPFYARFAAGEIYHTDEYAVIIFYRQPGCVPLNFNLLDGFDVPAVFDCLPTTTGSEIWIHEPLTLEFAPKQSELKGLGAVPVWFVSWPALQEAIGDNSLTIVELGAMDSLFVGSASFYHETLRPSPTVKKSTIEFNAMGQLEDGRTFTVHAIGVGDSCRTTIAFK
jgi:hypothetical protein